ncbi:hypothetical protein [Campylobacter devanensis]|uniref:hypothetical protein n=1 Tax=Campylobacter devanensis TaxID=3161138 RepID=UPI001F21FAD1|nr:hypothetical protein [Campylobacter sp. P0187]
MMQAEMMNGVNDKTGVRAEVNNTQIFGVVATGTIKDFMINGVTIGNITVKTNDSGKWDEVIAYTTKDNLEKDLKPMLDRAKQTYQESCSICHHLHKESQYNPNQWPSLFKSMLSRTPIDKKDEWLIIQYLQKASKGDIK